MRVLVTGSQGFIGKNLVMHLLEQERFSVLPFNRKDSIEDLCEKVQLADAIIHLAGENRPCDVYQFEKVNTGLTQLLCDAIRTCARKIPLVLASSIQAIQDNPYGTSKLAAEKAAEGLSRENGNPVFIYRLPNVFGKWCKPNYNSVVATFCHNIANDLPIQIHDESAQLRLVYVDDVVADIMRAIQVDAQGVLTPTIEPEYSMALGELAKLIQSFKHSRESLTTEPVGEGILRALYSTYVSYLDPDKFTYHIPLHEDERGVFVEMLKTKDSGQFSFFTARPGVTRGGHYHHSKTEKFLVIKGKARFRFRHVVTDESYEVFTKGDTPQVVDTVPGWIHDITNVGEEEMIVMLWANEIFDRNHPDTVSAKV